MVMGLLSNDRLAFGPLKPIVLRGSPDEDASYVFSSHATLSLSKPEKIANISVSLVSTSFVYFPEGIGARASKTTFEKTLSKQTLILLKEKTAFSAGVHTLPFTFIVPNSLVDTIEDEYGRVRHMVELQVGRTSKASLLNPWRISKPVLVLRTFLSNSLLLNHSVQDLSQTFDRKLTSADVTTMVDVAAVSPGDLFTIRFTIQPHQKHVRLESIEATVTESRRYAVSSLGAWRTTSDTFPLRYLYATPLVDSSLASFSPLASNMEALFNNKQVAALDLVDTFAYRITFATPTCKNNIHHTTRFEDILFRHRLDIQLTLSYLNDDGIRECVTLATPSSLEGTQPTTASHHQQPTTASSATATADLLTTVDSGSSSITSSPSQTWQSVLHKLRKGKSGNTYDNGRHYEKMAISTPIHVFNCRLKEDYGSLPSYFETGVVKPQFTTIMPATETTKTTALSPPPSPPALKTSKMHQIATPIDQRQYHAYLCECYFEFCQLMEVASHQSGHPASSLERIPSIPPPDYYVD
ncbi:hypothetical protein BCR42DRAFT_121397 [Absidia repens]|uniref:Arrestin-like N-terminal domain-containing protein n=1 Tax=Absidia repens TaxID=90262 RepID=A0A1X2I4G0_9FUNG|nr:hypothetical protein BCR42DRAFT_121397 [Absidia repens]